MKVNSVYRLFMQTDLSASDFKVLALLYQPIIGFESYALYSTFYNLTRQKELMTHRFIMDLLNIKQSEFIKCREQLEAVGLMESYKANDEEYLYILKSPFTAKQFVNDTFLGAYLESEIGEANFTSLISLFKVERPELAHLENITKNFDDLYEFKATSLMNLDYELEGRNGLNNKLITKHIDYEEFVDGLPRSLKSDILFNENFKQRILQLSYVYQFTIEDLTQVYTNAHKGRKNVSIEQLNFHAKSYYEKTNRDITVVDKEMCTEDTISNVPISALIEKFVEGDSMQKALALDTINTFIYQNDIDDGALKIMIMFILKNKNGILPHVNYLNKVWESWSNNGVRTAKDAIKHRQMIEQKWNNNNQSKYRKNPKVVDKPDWIDEYMNEISEMGV